MSKRSIVHIEIPAVNRETTAKFYKDLFGWDFQHVTEPTPMPYTTFESGSVGGGYPDLSDDYKPGDVLIYITSDDIEADLKEAEKLGAKTLVSKTEIPQTGWFGIFTDPTGNKIALWTELGK